MHIYFGNKSAFGIECEVLGTRRCYQHRGGICTVNPGKPCKCHLYEYKGIFIPNACRSGEFGVNHIRPSETNNGNIISISMSAPIEIYNGMHVLLTLGIINNDNTIYVCIESICMGLSSFTLLHLSFDTRTLLSSYSLPRVQDVIRINVEEGTLWGFYNHLDHKMYLHFLAIKTVNTSGVKTITYKYFTDFPGLIVQ